MKFVNSRFLVALAAVLASCPRSADAPRPDVGPSMLPLQESERGVSRSRLSGPAAVIFHNHVAVYVEQDPIGELWLVRLDDASDANGGHTIISSDRDGAHVLISDLGIGKKAGLMVSGVFQSGDSFAFKEPVSLTRVDPQRGLRSVKEERIK